MMTAIFAVFSLSGHRAVSRTLKLQNVQLQALLRFNLAPFLQANRQLSTRSEDGLRNVSTKTTMVECRRSYVLVF